jgi:ubiquinone biosynthesis accessory factor UbiJ
MMAAAAEVMFERLLDRAVARALADSPRATDLIGALRGRRLQIQVSGTPWRMVVESTGRTLKAYRAAAPAEGRADSPAAALADATIVGAPLSLLALTGADAQAVIQRGDVQICGDPAIAQQFRELGLLLRPDLEASLAPLLGRSGAHIALRGLRAVAQWTRNAAGTSVRNVAEYLAHESRDLVSRPESEHFLRGVDQAREQLDRVNARLQILEQRTQRLAGGQHATEGAAPTAQR